VYVSRTPATVEHSLLFFTIINRNMSENKQALSYNNKIYSIPTVIMAMFRYSYAKTENLPYIVTYE